MSKYIKLEDLQKFPIRINHYDKEHGNEHFVYGVETVLEYAEYLPTVYIEDDEVKHGHWQPESDRPNSAKFICSVCGELAYYVQPTRDKNWKKCCPYKYCPNCGASMTDITDEKS